MKSRCIADVESGLSTSSKGRGKAKEKDHKEALKAPMAGTDLYHRARKEAPFFLPSIYMARLTNIIKRSRGWSLDLSIVQVLKAPSDHGNKQLLYKARLGSKLPAPIREN